jgi:hypothetical protein
MECLYKQWDHRHSTFGNVAFVGFLLAQTLDGVFTYLGVSLWGPRVEANPLIGSLMTVVGPASGLAGAKLMAIGFGMALHLRRVHNLVAFLTIVYVAVAILPWTAVFLAN